MKGALRVSPGWQGRKQWVVCACREGSQTSRLMESTECLMEIHIVGQDQRLAELGAQPVVGALEIR